MNEKVVIIDVAGAKDYEVMSKLIKPNDVKNLDEEVLKAPDMKRTSTVMVGIVGKGCTARKRYHEISVESTMRQPTLHMEDLKIINNHTEDIFTLHTRGGVIGFNADFNGVEDMYCMACNKKIINNGGIGLFCNNHCEDEFIKKTELKLKSDREDLVKVHGLLEEVKSFECSGKLDATVEMLKKSEKELSMIIEANIDILVGVRDLHGM